MEEGGLNQDGQGLPRVCALGSVWGVSGGAGKTVDMCSRGEGQAMSLCEPRHLQAGHARQGGSYNWQSKWCVLRGSYLAFRGRMVIYPKGPFREIVLVPPKDWAAGTAASGQCVRTPESCCGGLAASSSPRPAAGQETNNVGSPDVRPRSPVFTAAQILRLVTRVGRGASRTQCVVGRGGIREDAPIRPVLGVGQPAEPAEGSDSGSRLGPVEKTGQQWARRGFGVTIGAAEGEPWFRLCHRVCTGAS